MINTKYTNVRMYVCVHVCMCVCLCVCVYVCVYVCVSVLPRQAKAVGKYSIPD